MTIFLTTHYMEEADQLCDRIGIIDSGKIQVIDSPENMKNAIIFGSTLASFCVEKFGTRRIEDLSDEEVKRRLSAFKELTQFDINLS